MSKYVHIAIGCSAAGLLKYTLNKHSNHEFFGTVINFNQDLSVGPLNVSSKERESWLQNIRYELDYDVEDEEFYKLPTLKDTEESIINIPKDKIIILWYANNVIEQTAIRCIAPLVMTHTLYHVQIPEHFVNDANESQCIRATAECNSKLLWLFFEKYLKLVSNDLLSEWIAKWEKLILDYSTLRIYQDNIIVSVDEDYYDAIIIASSSREWKYAARVIGQALGSEDQVISDLYLEYRLRHLIKAGYLDYRGELKRIRNYEVARVKSVSLCYRDNKS